MPNTLDATGLTIKTYAEIYDEIAQALKDTIAQTLDTEEESPLGQIIAAHAAQLREALELLQAAFNAQDPAQGSGFGLAQVSSITGTIRRAATSSTDLLDLDLDAGTYPAGTLIVHVQGQPTARFANKEGVTSPGGTVTGVLMEAESTGPTVANAGTLTVIAETVAGFNSVDDDPADATLGALAESDTALRIRRVQEIYRRGSTSVDAIYADLVALEGVTYVAVLENDTDVTDANGLPPHSIEAIVEGTATAATIRSTIFASKAAGIQAYGTSSGTVVDSSGNSHVIAYSTPTAVPIDMTATFTYLTSVFADDATAEAAVEEAILAAFAAYQDVGRDVLYRRYEAAALALDGVVDCVVACRRDADPFASTNIVIAARERATLAAADLNHAASGVGAAP